MPAEAVIRGLADLEHNHDHSHGERCAGCDRPTGGFGQKCGGGEREKDRGPSELEGARHAHDVAEEEEVRDDEGDDEAPPEFHGGEVKRGGDAEEDDDDVADGEAEARLEVVPRGVRATRGWRSRRRR